MTGCAGYLHSHHQLQMVEVAGIALLIVAKKRKHTEED